VTAAAPSPSCASALNLIQHATASDTSCYESPASYAIVPAAQEESVKATRVSLVAQTSDTGRKVVASTTSAKSLAGNTERGTVELEHIRGNRKGGQKGGGRKGGKGKEEGWERTARKNKNT